MNDDPISASMNSSKMNKTHSSGLIGAFVRHPNAANLLMALMILFGIYGLSKLKTQFFPTIKNDSITLSITWPGASAEDVEANILEAIEPSVRFIDGVNKITAYAREGAATVFLEFAENTDMQKAQSDVEQAVDALSILPQDSETPKVSRTKWHDTIARIALKGPFSEDALKIFAKRIRDDLLARGIDRVTFEGVRDSEYVIAIPERELRRLEMTIHDVAEHISSNTRDVPSGNLDGDVERQLRVLAVDGSLTGLAKIAVKTLPTGERVLLRDIAHIEKQFNSDQPRGFSNGDPAIELTVQRVESADTISSAAILDHYLAEIQPTLPKSLTVVKYEVRAERLNDRIMLLINNGLTGLCLVVAILFIFLNARIALWVAAGIPIAMLAAIGFMWISGQTINMISLFALIMTLGIIVDDAIVVGEHTATRFAFGEDPIVAAQGGANGMFIPVLGASMTTIAAFLPILLIGDTIGQIMGALPMVIIAVLIASLIECFLILPGHLAHSLAKPRNKTWSWWRHGFLATAFVLFAIGLSRQNGAQIISFFTPLSEFLYSLHANYGGILFNIVILTISFLIAGAIEGIFYYAQQIERLPLMQKSRTFRDWFDTKFNWFRDHFFRKFVSLSYQWRYVTISLSCASLIIAIGFLQGGRIGFVFFPSPEAENISARITFNAGIRETDAIAAIQDIENALQKAEKELVEVNTQDTLVVASFVTLGKAGRSQGDNVASIDVQLTASEARSVRTPAIVKAWRRAMPHIAGVKRIAIYEKRGGPPGRDLDIRLQNAPSATLKAASIELQDILSSYPGISGVADDLPFGKPELAMKLTPRGVALGFTISSVGEQIRNAIHGSIANRLAQGDEEITIRLRKILNGKGGGALRNLELKAPSGEYAPLTEIVTLTDRQGFSVIQRRDGKTTLSVTADVDHMMTSNADIIKSLMEGPMPALATRYGIDYQFSGRAEERENAFADLRIGSFIALGLIYIILAWIFASYLRPIAVMLIIPFGVVGAIFGHYIMGFPLTILSVIGLLGLSGILVNNAIILVSRLDERLSQGETIDEASIGASQDRLRAVLLTSCTTIGGLTPLLFEKSLQAQFLMPMVITIVFGLATATALVLFLVPSLIGVGADIARIYRLIYDHRAFH